MTDQEEKYLTVQQVADRLKVSRQTVYNWIDRNQLVAMKAGRRTLIAQSAVDAFLKPFVPSEKQEAQKGK